MPYVLAFDPGGHSGWQLAFYDKKTPVRMLVGGQIPNGVVGFAEWCTEQLGAILRRYKIKFDDLEIVSESFKVRFTHADVTPLRIEGAQTVLFGPDKVQYQTPGDKRLYDDSKLKLHSLWVPGHRHQNDARIHVMVYLLKKKHQPTLREYFTETE